jgi:hypothetical protein
MKKAFGLLLVLGLAVVASAPAPSAGTGTLVARVEGPPGQSLPRELAVRVRPSLELVGQETLTWERTVSCPVRNGEWRCEAPPGRVDLRITGPAMLPVHRWGVTVPEGGTADLGTLRLWRGASITGAVRPNSEIPQYPIQVDLLDTVSDPDAKPVRTARLESGSRPWGFFRFDGVPPGYYALLVKDLNLPVLRYGPIKVEGDQAFDIPEPMLLKRLSLAVEIHPPQDPNGRPWQVRYVVQPMLRIDRFPLPQEASVDGSVYVRDLAPGDYRVVVTSEPPSVHWGEKTFHLGKEKQPLRFDFRPVRLRGSVLYQGRPLKASVTMWGEDTRSSFSFFSDENGKFEGYVPEEKAWKVRVAAPGIVLTLQDPVPMTKLGGSATLEVRVPDTLLPVEVVDARGKRVVRSAVKMLDEVKNQFDQYEGSAPGPLEIVGLKPGLHRLVAIQDDPLRMTKEVEVTLREGEKKKPLLRLELPDVIEIRGRVHPRFGSPQGTQVFLWPAESPPGEPYQGRGSILGPSGTLSLFLPAPVVRFHAMVLPPGNALRLLEDRAVDCKTLDLPVRPAGGTLVLEGPGFLVDVPERELGQLWKLSPAMMLRHWANLQSTPQSPDRLLVPNVEPGPYTLCPGSPFTLHRRMPRPEETGCTGGVLKAAGELVLRLGGV